ncbi:ABC transporter substrate-binding protein [Bordetella sp. BOR01]|uniref:ABC transporter substrate-binding protein n=1 Tax=Bordetella sp. BOR01 TaxID=2854779 RepID=UPI001C4416FB|nr:ABC transporter substrate-binding protein [Bordetella sp. BOR01]MBV7483160.1 ABC transporter substrate-binding protein [Bordetella sp. BOR01]
MTISSSSRRHFLIAGAGTVIGLSLTGSLPVQAAGEAGNPAKGGRLRVSVSDRTGSLNPFVQLNGTGYLLNEMLYMGITRLGPDMKPEGDAVLGWEANGDLTEFTFTMRPNLVFHDGTPVTAADAVASIKAVLDPRFASPAMRSIGLVQDVAVIDPSHFKMVLKRRDANLPVALSHINLRLIPASIINGDPKVLETEVHGSGPFQLSSHEPGRRTMVERFDKYHDPRYPLLDGVDVILYPDAAAENAALVNGETDVMLRVASADYDRISKTGNVKGRRQGTGGFLNIVLRTDTKPFDDLRVRQAIQLCLDRDVLTEIVLEGYGRPAYDNVISPEYRYGLPLEPFKPDIEKARALLAEAGYPDGIRITCYASNSPKERGTLAVAFKELAKPAGIDVDVQVISYDQYVANVWKKAACYVSLWNMMPTEDAMYTQYLTSDAPYNDSAYKNPAFDKLVEDARSSTDDAQRAQLYKQAQQMLVHDLPWLIPFYRDYLSAHATHVNDYTTHPLIYPHFLERVWMTRKG